MGEEDVEQVRAVDDVPADDVIGDVGAPAMCVGAPWVRSRRGSADPESANGSPGPFIFIATNKLKPGKLADEARRVPGLAAFIQASEPRVITFNEYASDDGTEVAVVQVHPDADSMAYHMGVVGERAQRAYAETLDSTTSIQVFGTPSEEILEMLRQAAGTGVPITVRPSHLGGFTRRG